MLEASQLGSQDAQHLLGFAGVPHNLRGGDKSGLPPPPTPCQPFFQAVLT